MKTQSIKLLLHLSGISQAAKIFHSIMPKYFKDEANCGYGDKQSVTHLLNATNGLLN